MTISANKSEINPVFSLHTPRRKIANMDLRIPESFLRTFGYFIHYHISPLMPSIWRLTPTSQRTLTPQPPYPSKLPRHEPPEQPSLPPPPPTNPNEQTYSTTIPHPSIFLSLTPTRCRGSQAQPSYSSSRRSGGERRARRRLRRRRRVAGGSSS